MTTPQPAAHIGQLVGSWARATPNAPALLAPGWPVLTFRDLDTRLNALAAALSSAGVSRSDRVAIAMPNGPEMAIAMLATAAYATCAPLNPGYRDEDFRFYLGDLRPKALLLPIGHTGPARAVADALEIRCIDVDAASISPSPQCALPCNALDSGYCANPACGSGVALVLHTSGTTSRPKIVPLTHRNLCASAYNVATTLALRPADRCLNVMPLFHIHGFVAALLASLSAGGSVVCTDGLREGNFAAWIDEFQPTWYTAVPTIHHAVLEQLRNDPGRSVRGRLRLARSSSAPLPPSVARDLEDWLDVPVIEAYGMTEAAHQIASNPLPPAARKPGTVGLPAGPELAIIDEHGHPLAAGQLGEIAIRGENVTPGYLANGDADAAAFAGGWLRTGDQGRIDGDGYLTITGRLKEMINRGGEKVAPREVDEALLAHPAVRQAVAFAVPHPTLGEDIAAAVVLRTGTDATESALRRFLFDRLAELKVPSRIVITDAIPTGATGKMQRIGLAAHFAGKLAPSLAEPSTETEHAVAALFAEVLDVPAVGACDNFFALGGDSLRGAQVIARVQSRFGLSLRPLALFRSPTVAEFAGEIDRMRNRHAA